LWQGFVIKPTAAASGIRTAKIAVPVIFSKGYSTIDGVVDFNVLNKELRLTLHL
jgi:hypothetical protein